MIARLSEDEMIGGHIGDEDIFNFDRNSPESLNDDLSHTNTVTPTLYLMGQGDKRDMKNIVKTFPLPPQPTFNGTDLHRLTGKLLHRFADLKTL